MYHHKQVKTWNVVQMAEHQSRIPENTIFRPKAIRLMDQVREVLRYHHYSIRTEEVYVRWILAFIRFHDRQHPKDLGREEIEAFLSDLAVNRNVAASTQNQALIAIVFLYKHVLDLPIPDDLTPVRSKKPPRLPVVLSQKEVKLLLDEFSGSLNVMACLMYGGGLRLMEVVRLRVQDIDFENGFLMIRDGKGGRDRSTLLPVSLVAGLQTHLEEIRKRYDKDVRDGVANVWLPNALAKKYPNAPASWEWQYVFASKILSKDPRSGEIRRHHISESGLQKAIRNAYRKVGINKRVTTHTLRHSFATHLLEAGTNIQVHAKIIRSCRCEDNRDLYACFATKSQRCDESFREYFFAVK